LQIISRSLKLLALLIGNNKASVHRPRCWGRKSVEDFYFL